MKHRHTFSPLVTAFINLATVYVIYMVCRIIFVLENWGLYAQGWDDTPISRLLVGALRFDTSAIFYTNALYLFMLFLPFAITEKVWWRAIRKWVFIVMNAVAVVANLCDAVYSQFTGRRTTATFFTEFAGDDNLGKIFFTEAGRHWYLLIAGIILIAMLWLLYWDTDPEKERTKKKGTWKIVSQWGVLLGMTILTLAAMRGGIFTAYRPIAVADACKYVNRPTETSIVLNTPFSVIRTIGKTAFVNPHYFSDEELEGKYTPVHWPDTLDTDTSQSKKNVVVIILESFGREYIGFYNKKLDNGRYKGYTPFLDSLLSISTSWEQTYANARRSIDAMPAILSSIPMFIEPFFMTGYSQNEVSSLAGELRKEGYSTAFFHGADNGSMGFESYALATGFQHYYGRNEYNADSRFNGDEDFDGTWAIWDEPFLQYYAMKMGEMEQPFATAVFTASSHHPFAIPQQYKSQFPEEELPIHKCIRYTDNALRKFFATASQQPWFENTIFVITNDHSNQSNHNIYKTSLGLFNGTLLIYDPSGSTPSGVMPGIAQQTDIMPTVLALLGYDKPFVAYGNDLMHSSTKSRWTVNYSNGIYQYLQNDTLIQFDGQNVVGTFCPVNDPMLKKPIATPPTKHTERLKAIIQQYMSRMINDELLP